MAMMRKWFMGAGIAIMMMCFMMPTPSQAGISGYAPESYPANLGYNCAASQIECVGKPLTLLDQVFSNGFDRCLAYGGNPTRCVSLANKIGVSTDPYQLFALAFAAVLDYQAGESMAYRKRYYVSYGNCREATTSSYRYFLCDTFSQSVIGDGTPGNPYGLDGINIQGSMSVSQNTSATIMCQGYIPGLGCPTGSAARTVTAPPAECGICPANPQGEVVAPQAAKNPSRGNPISLLSGAKTEAATDISWPIVFARNYDSTRALSSGFSMGAWRHNHDSKLQITMGATATPFVGGLVFSLEDGQEIVFKRLSATAAFALAFGDQKGYAVTASAGGWLLTLPSMEKRQYDSAGHMVSRLQRSGYQLSYAYDGVGNMTQISDSYGRSLTLSYAAGMVSQVQASNGAATDTVAYAYSGGLLTSATFNAAETTSYGYDAAGRMASVTDALGHLYAQFAYDASGRANQSKHLVGGVATEQTDIVYGTSSISVTENGATSVYSTDKDAQNVKPRVTTVALGGSASNYQVLYDTTGLATGLKTGTYTNSYSVDVNSALPTALSRAQGGTATYTWDVANRLLTGMVETSPKGTRTSSMTYDGMGNMASLSVLSSFGGAARAKSWTYGAFGKVLTSTDVDGAVTTYEYYPDDSAQVAVRGALKKIVNPLGHEINMISYDSRGNPTMILDQNGIQTTLAYDAHGRVVSKSRDGASVSYVYDAEGQLTSVAFSGGVTLAMAYDDAHRMASLSSTSGESMQFAYDAYGNRVQDNAYQGSSLIQTLNRAYTPLRQVSSTWAATQSEAQSSVYNVNGMPTTRSDGLGRASTYTYNALGLVASYQEPGMTASLSRDADGNLTSYSGGNVTVTNYVWNDFQELLSVTSPDTGSQAMTHDPGARVDTLTDAAGIVHSATRDALGRVASSTHVLGSATMSESYVYDGPGDKGRLMSASDDASSQAWTWNPKGLPLSKVQLVGAASLALGYDYDAQGRLTSVTYPSGMVVGYAWTNGKIASVTVDGSPFINGITYRPFSDAPVSWSWAAGGSYLKSFDANGKVTGLSDTGYLAQVTAFDGAGRLTSLSDTGLALAPSYATGDQLSAVSVNGQTQTFGVDVNWNRNAKKYFNGQTDSVSMNYQTNLPSQVANTGPPATYKSWTYDARKNTTNNGRGTFVYDLRGNLAQATVGTVVSTYGYNAQNQRVKKTVGGVSTIFLNDELGNLAGEYSATGSAQAEHVYLAGLPVAVKIGSVLSAVHTDYLGTPRVVSSGSTIVWKWDSTDPFGVNLPSVSTITYNPRFPGQYYDAETGLHNNGFRVYDPMMGRYLQPDPIGLAGGKNPFNYVNHNPLNAIDRKGEYIEVIHVLDNSMGGLSLDHLALNINGVIFDVNIGLNIGISKNGFGSNMWGPAVDVEGRMRSGLFAKYFANKTEQSLQYQSVFLNTSLVQEETIKNFFIQISGHGGMTAQRYGGNGGLVCSSAITEAFSLAGLPRIGGGNSQSGFGFPIRPSDVFNEIATGSAYASLRAPGVSLTGMSTVKDAAPPLIPNGFASRPAVLPIWRD